MNLLIPDKASKNSNPHCADLTEMAERELSAFFKAVTEVFGAKQAELSAEDWLHELAKIDGLPPSTHEWRLITLKVLTRLARRVNVSALSPEFSNA